MTHNDSSLVLTEPTFSQLLGQLDRSDTSEDTSTVKISQNWMQGRTTYGGMSAALCYQAAINHYPDLPALRSAQINFVGPAGGDVQITTRIMRRGRSVAYISAEINGEKGLATHAVLCFGQTRESRLHAHFTNAPDVPGVEQSRPFFKQTSGPSFAANYECLLSKGGHPISGSSDHEHYIWVRHRDEKANDLAALIGIADMPPPAVLPMFEQPAPISSMTWMLNFLKEDISTEDGWWLMRSAAEHAHKGYSSQDMQVWNRAGELVISGLQNVAIFY